MRMKTTLPASIEGQNNDRLLMENEYNGDDEETLTGGSS